MALSESSPGVEDHVVIDLAIHERRMVITEDKDFGQLVYAEGRATGGVLLLRFPARARALMAQSTVTLLKQRRERLVGRFVVLQPGRVRIGGVPRKGN